MGHELSYVLVHLLSFHCKFTAMKYILTECFLLKYFIG